MRTHGRTGNLALRSGQGAFSRAISEAAGGHVGPGRGIRVNEMLCRSAGRRVLMRMWAAVLSGAHPDAPVGRENASG